jgi:hypothetical protein
MCCCKKMAVGLFVLAVAVCAKPVVRAVQLEMEYQDKELLSEGAPQHADVWRIVAASILEKVGVAMMHLSLAVKALFS